MPGEVRMGTPVREGTISRVQDRYNLSVPSVLLRAFGSPTVPQHQRDTLTHPDVNRRAAGSSPARGANSFISADLVLVPDESPFGDPLGADRRVSGVLERSKSASRRHRTNSGATIGYPIQGARYY